MGEHITGFKVRVENGVEVLDGDQSATAYVCLGAQVEDDEHTNEFKDGTPVKEACEAMDQDAQVLLDNIDSGWFVVKEVSDG